MILAEIVLAAPGWLTVAVALAIAALTVLAMCYSRTRASTPLRVACFALKGSAILLLAVCLLEPMYVGSRPRPGSNLFLVVADNSRSLQLVDRGGRQSRGAAAAAVLNDKAGFLARLGQDFDVRTYTFADQLQPVTDFSKLNFAGQSSALAGCLTELAGRYRGQPVAGILLLTDGNATDLADQASDWKSVPPIYPVTLAGETSGIDLALSQLSVSQTNFETAPVTLVAEIDARSAAGRKIVVRVVDHDQREVERRVVSITQDVQRVSERFLLKPDRRGISFYEVQAALEGEESLTPSSKSLEATLANNRRLATVNRGSTPFRVLYVSGMPNWEFKFLRRAVAKDDQVNLVGLLRIAKKEPKFTFLSRDGERTNPLFRGFGNKDDEQAEQYDQPVLLRLGTDDKEELRGGFPQDVEELFRYDAIILDDVEAAFFTQDQLSLLQQFVSQRGGGLLMMGGKGSFAEGGYGRTAVAEMLPVYLDRNTADRPAESYRLRLTREGWLQPWMRLRTTEQDEKQRLAGMPAFHTVNRVTSIKPGASVLAEVETPTGEIRPALVVQPFGRGRTAALLIGDLWRWQLRRAELANSDLEKSWRQTVRWLVADVPQSVEVETRRAVAGGSAGMEVVVRTRDKRFAPLDNAAVKVRVTTPENRQIEITAESSDSAPGEYRALLATRAAGAYRAVVSATAPDGSTVGERETGWVVEPETEEFRSLAGNGSLLERIATDSGGETLELDSLDDFVASLPNRKIPVVETWSYPLWHHWSMLTLAFGCLVGEWGLRRWRGLA